MTTEWKPGDVALTQFGRSVVFSGKRCGHYDSTPHWHHVTNGGWDPLDSHPAARPLVVIDPEDREQVERLSSLVEANGGPRFGGRGVDSLAAALREFANPKPPKPEEPTGLGAVVEDESRRRWVRGDRDVIGWTNCGDWRRWDEINAVEVLSEGVQP